MTTIQFGLMIRGQFPQEDDMQQRFAECMEMVRHADRLGFACITKGSHYAGYPLQDIQQLPFLTRAMVEGPNLRLNAGIILLSLHKPLDLAEQLASIDVMSGGRLIFGAALGYREVEFLGFGTTQRDRVQRFEENLAAIKRLWGENDVNMVGSHFQLKDASTSIKPVQKPHPPIWIGANADPAIRRAAKVGDCWYVNPHNRIGTILKQTEIYKRALDEYDRPFPEEFPIRREVFVAKNREEALRLCAPYLATKYKVYHQWGQDKVMPEGDNDLSLEFDDLAHDRFLIGSPDEVADECIRLHRETGVNHIIASMQWPGMDYRITMDAMQLLSEEVFPKVNQAV